jgi:hypothetical protein
VGKELSELLRSVDEANTGAAAAAIWLIDEGKGPPVSGNLLLDHLGDGGEVEDAWVDQKCGSGGSGWEELEDLMLRFTSEHGQGGRLVGDEGERPGTVPRGEIEVDGEEGEIGEPGGPELPVQEAGDGEGKQPGELVACGGDDRARMRRNERVDVRVGCDRSHVEDDRAD